MKPFGKYLIPNQQQQKNFILFLWTIVTHFFDLAWFPGIFLTGVAGEGRRTDKETEEAWDKVDWSL